MFTAICFIILMGGIEAKILYWTQGIHHKDKAVLLSFKICAPKATAKRSHIASNNTQHCWLICWPRVA